MNWISVKDRLPEKDGYYPVWVVEDGEGVGDFDSACFWSTDSDFKTDEFGWFKERLTGEVTHWGEVSPPIEHTRKKILSSLIAKVSYLEPGNDLKLEEEEMFAWEDVKREVLLKFEGKKSIGFHRRFRHILIADD